MMAHWVARVERTTALQLKTALITFHNLCGKHDSKTLAKTVMKLLDRAQIMVKVCFMQQRSQSCSDISLNVGHFTLDNAANNGTMMRHLEEILCNRDIVFDVVDHKIMCFAHVIDLCTKQVTHHAGNTVDSDKDDSHQSDYEAATTDPIAHGHDIV
jgi:hypothetical protein